MHLALLSAALLSVPLCSLRSRRAVDAARASPTPTVHCAALYLDLGMRVPIRHARSWSWYAQWDKTGPSHSHSRRV